MHTIKHSVYGEMFNQVRGVVVGYDEIIALCIRGLLTGNHILLTSLPGLAKTTLANTLGATIENAKCGRIQMLPDTQPSDVVGGLVFNMKSGEYQPALGPIHGSNIFLADEVNRTGPKTNAAMLQAMQEGRVTIGDTTYPMEKVFMVIATRNPVEQEGTYDLPEAMIDRFQAEANLPYVSADDEFGILSNIAVHKGDPSKLVKKVVTLDQILTDRAAIQAIAAASSEQLKRYIVALVRATRPGLDEFKRVKDKDNNGFENKVAVGASPRAQINLLHAASAAAFLAGRDAVTPDDVKYVARDILRARIAKKEAAQGKFNVDDFVTAILNSTPIL